MNSEFLWGQFLEHKQTDDQKMRCADGIRMDLRWVPSSTSSIVRYFFIYITSETPDTR